VKEIKAYIQRHRVNKVVDELEKAGVSGITIVEVHPVQYGYDPNYFEYQIDDAFKRYKIWHIVKLEIVCDERDLDRFTDIIRDVCVTGAKGDGMIFISDVAAAIRIRDGARDLQAL
jgi:nitrogen regulatory protein PII